MAFRNLFIENEAQLKIRNSQLLITTEETKTVPAEDICTVILENARSTISAAALARLSQEGAAVYVCDEKHLPCAVLLPFMQHSRNFQMLKAQNSLSLPASKRLWQEIVKKKIANQARCLELAGKDEGSGKLRKLSRSVASGDSGNVEAAAAACYFKCLFGKEFSRNSEGDIRNGFLNYGYSIIRGHIARLIASYGFLPAKGIHHRNETNAFNLADDFIEPFRPAVDLHVAMTCHAESALTPAIKHGLYNLLNVDMCIDGKNYTVAYSAELLVQSFSRCCQNNSKELLLPDLLPLVQHSYE